VRLRLTVASSSTVGSRAKVWASRPFARHERRGFSPRRLHLRTAGAGFRVVIDFRRPSASFDWESRTEPPHDLAFPVARWCDRWNSTPAIAPTAPEGAVRKMPPGQDRLHHPPAREEGAPDPECLRKARTRPCSRARLPVRPVRKPRAVRAPASLRAAPRLVRVVGCHAPLPLPFERRRSAASRAEEGASCQPMQPTCCHEYPRDPSAHEPSGLRPRGRRLRHRAWPTLARELDARRLRNRRWMAVAGVSSPE
jgi:hypothetical protein